MGIYSRGSIRLSALPFSMFFQFIISSSLCRRAQSRTSLLAVLEDSEPANSSPSKVKLALSPEIQRGSEEADGHRNTYG